MKDIDDFTV